LADVFTVPDSQSRRPLIHGHHRAALSHDSAVCH
jgi:hypothetical protein